MAKKKKIHKKLNLKIFTDPEKEAFLLHFNYFAFISRFFKLGKGFGSSFEKKH